MSRSIVVAWINRDPHSAFYGCACAAVWSHASTVADLIAARAYGNSHGARVYLFAEDDADMLARARRSVVGKPCIASVSRRA